MAQLPEPQPLNQVGIMKTLSAQLPHQKAVNSIKQVTQIRKITQQTLSPVIKKVQEHIAFLLQESKALRIQTSTLQQVQATNLEYKQQIQHLKTKVSQLQGELLQITQKNQLKQKENEKKLTEHQGLIQDLSRDGKQKGQKIKKLIGLNQSQAELFGMAKEGMVNAVDTLKQEIASFYDKTIRLNNQNTQKFTSLNNSTLEHRKRIQLIQNGMKQLSNITNLYTSQRQQIRNYLQQLMQLSQQAVLREEYQKDKRYHTLQNQLLKSYVQKTVNQALTPEIRAFLLTLIQNIQLLKKIQKQIISCTSDIHTSKQTQKELHQKILRFQYSTKKSIQQRQIEIKKLSLQLQSKTQSINQEIIKIYDKVQPRFEQIEAVLRKYKTDSDQMFQTFIEKNRTKIYLAVLECKPPEVRQQQNRIRQKLDSFDQKMNQITQKANQRSDNVLHIGNALDVKLQLFQNRITKARSDLKVQNDNMKKIIQGFNLKLQQSQQKNHQQSQVISKLLEVCMLNTSLHIDQEYLQVNSGKYGQENSESYISFHDGVIYQTNGETKRNQTIYRKKKLNKEILKRSLLNQQAKLIDFITEKLKNWRWNQQKQRPSHFFVENVYPAYENMFKEKMDIIEAKRNYYEDRMGSYKMPSINMLSQRRSKDSIVPGNSTSKIQPMTSKHLSKGSFDEKEKSKEKEKKKFNNTSIDVPRGTSLVERIQAISQHSELHTTMDFHKPNRIKLKKIDQQQKQRQSIRENNDGNTSKNRYMFGKQTIYWAE